MSLTTVAENYATSNAFRHEIGEMGRESMAHMLLMPEHGIAGWIYPTQRSGEDPKTMFVGFGPGLAEPIIETVQAPTDSTDFDDWRVGPMRMAVTDPFKSVDLSWAGERVTFTGRYEALHAPYAFSMHPFGNPPYYGDDRTEQHGTIEAEFTIDGMAYRHSGLMIRDHSWGPRIWGLNQHYKWLHAVTRDVSVHVFEMNSFGRRPQIGFLRKDGEMAHIKNVDFKIGYDDDMVHRSVDMTVTDELNRTVAVQASQFAYHQNRWDPMVYLNESAMDVDIDGVSGVGWYEFCWTRDYFDFAKQHVSRFGRE